ncbi:MAG: DMT family transporter [Crocinitomicaceae bacterium]|nr:DMT family transporter [Crocinitomicaceae bacterium]MDG1735511.1 DMT family transporter [Crocinitomicaceae bacterium]MDG2506354.1 DMT family transporter [Crocinitomicaceae bacterium]
MKISAKYWLLLLLLSLIWGSSFILMKTAMYNDEGASIFSSNQVATLRILIASIALLPFGLFAIRKVNFKKDLFSFVIVALCGNLLPAFLFTYAETGITSGLAGMLNSTTPIFTIFIALIIFNDQISARQFTGAFIGLLGVTALIYFGKQNSLSGEWSHIISVVCATLCYAISLSVIRYKLSHYKSLDIASVAFLLLLIPAIGLFFLEDTLSVFKNTEDVRNGFGSILILSLIGTALALFIFNTIIKNTSALFASSVTYFIPIVAVIIGLFFNERINGPQIGGMLIALMGVFIANSKKH